MEGGRLKIGEDTHAKWQGWGSLRTDSFLPTPSPANLEPKGRSEVKNFAYRTPHLLEIQAVNHTRELTDFFSSQVVTLLLLKCLFVFKL